MRTILTTLASNYAVTEPPSTTWLSINAEDLPDISELYEVTAVPFLVLVRGGKTLETVSGSDAVKVREAVERHAEGSQRSSAAILPPAQKVDAGAAPAPAATKDLSGYAPPADTAAETPESKEAAQKELFKRLEQLVSAAPVMLFMKGTPSAPQCGFSRKVVALLREKGVRYGFFNILADDDVRQGLKEYADWPTFPQLWVGGELVGGLDIVSSFLPQCFLDGVMLVIATTIHNHIFVAYTYLRVEMYMG
jgi:Grx4 family monothiol glutaredoxin